MSFPGETSVKASASLRAVLGKTRGRPPPGRSRTRVSSEIEELVGIARIIAQRNLCASFGVLSVSVVSFSIVMRWKSSSLGRFGVRSPTVREGLIERGALPDGRASDTNPAKGREDERYDSSL